VSDAPLGTAPGSAGEMQAVDITAKIDADTGPAEATVKSLGQRLIGVAQSSTTALAGIGRSLGSENFLAPITGMITSMGAGLDMLGQRSANMTKLKQESASAQQEVSRLNNAINQAKPGTAEFQKLNGELDTAKTRASQLESQFNKFDHITGMISGIGIAVAGLGAALQTMGAPLQRSQAALETAIGNTNTAAGTGQAAIAAYKGQMDAAEKSGAKYGYTLSDMGGALAKLTVQTQDPAEALKELTFAETLAAASGVSVSRAAEMIGRMHPEH
jgi:DNA repair exonuclease SbcCD ATPase subunit